MSGAKEAGDTLKDAARAAFLDCYECGSRLARAHAGMRRSEDIIEVMRGIMELIVHAADLHDAAERAEKSLRAKLATVMEETGATTIASEWHTVHLSSKPQFVTIPDESAVPSEYLVTKTAPDKRAILQLLKGDAKINWASLHTPKEQTLVLKARKVTA